MTKLFLFILSVAALIAVSLLLLQKFGVQSYGARGALVAFIILLSILLLNLIRKNG